MSVSNAATWLLESEGDFAVKEAPYSPPGPNEVVVKNGAVAINPRFRVETSVSKKYPFTIGADMAGQIFEVGEGVTTYKKGDRVMAKANWIKIPDAKYGAFQHYTVCDAKTIALLPDHISFAEGSVLPLALCTAAMGLYPPGRLELPLPSVPVSESVGKTIIVSGGSSSCGSAAIQFAVASGVTVIATASSRNHELVKGFGAMAVLDYNNPTIVDDLVQEVKNTGGEFVGALDAIATEETVRSSAAVVRVVGSGKVITNLPSPVSGIPDGVEVVAVNDTSYIGDREEIGGPIWGRFIPEALKTGVLKPVPEPLVIGKGLEKVIEGIALLRKGVSAKKIVVEL